MYLMLLIRYGELGAVDGGESAYGHQEQGGGDYQERGGEPGDGQRFAGS